MGQIENTTGNSPRTLQEAWRASRAKYPYKTAVTDSHGKLYTYERGDIKGAQLARYLMECGVRRGDVISCQLPGWAEFLPIYLACLKIGAAINPIAPNLRYHELKQIIGRCKSRALFLPRSYRNFTYCEMAGDLRAGAPNLVSIVAVDKYEEGSSLPTLDEVIGKYPAVHFSDAERIKAGGPGRPEDLGVIIFTSGSEGEAKGVMLSNRNILAAEYAFSNFFHIGPDDVMFMPAPLAHAIGFHHGFVMPLIVGGTSVLQDRFNADSAIDIINTHRATVTMAPTPFLHDIVNSLHENPRDISSLRFYLCGGSPPNYAKVREAAKIGLTVLNVYGATESVPHMGTPPDATQEQKDRQALFPMPGIDVRVVDAQGNEVADGEQGEEISFSEAVFMGYMDMPEATAAALKKGWYHSGDLCRKLPDGSYAITGRLKEIIVRGGENISSLEVETILLDHHKIAEAAVVSMPDQRLQERICAYLVLKNGETEVTLEELAHHFNERRVAKMKCPERIEILLEMPRTASGKINKTYLRKDIADKIEKGK